MNINESVNSSAYIIYHQLPCIFLFSCVCCWTNTCNFRNEVEKLCLHLWFCIGVNQFYCGFLGSGSVNRFLGSGSVNRFLSSGSVYRFLGSGSVNRFLSSGSINRFLSSGSVNRFLGSGSINQFLSSGSVYRFLGSESVNLKHENMTKQFV